MIDGAKIQRHFIQEFMMVGGKIKERNFRHADDRLSWLLILPMRTTEFQVEHSLELSNRPRVQASDYSRM